MRVKAGCCHAERAGGKGSLKLEGATFLPGHVVNNGRVSEKERERENEMGEP